MAQTLAQVIRTAEDIRIKETYVDIQMEEIYGNVDWAKHVDQEPPANESTLRNAKKGRHGRGRILLGLLSVFLLLWLVGLAVSYSNLMRRSWDIEANLTERLTSTERELSALTVERDTLNSNLTRQSRELERLRAETRERRNCPDRWTRFSSSCYQLSSQPLSWERARVFCIKKGAELVAIKNDEEQKFVSAWITGDTWIGLNDRERENTWRWSKDDSPLTLAFWSGNQPDNGGGSIIWGEEDCVHLEVNTKKWNDRRCDNTLNFICEKMV